MEAVAKDREIAFGKRSIPSSGYIWCLHCNRTYKYGKCRRVKRGEEEMAIEREVHRKVMKKLKVKSEDDKFMQDEFYEMCPYADCDGDAVLDAINWEKIREQHNEYPEVPEDGVFYDW